MNTNSSQRDDYEAAAFLATVSFTTVPQLSEMNISLFEKFCLGLTVGLDSAKVLCEEFYFINIQ
jgi:hypothetical protein